MGSASPGPWWALVACGVFLARVSLPARRSPARLGRAVGLHRKRDAPPYAAPVVPRGHDGARPHSPPGRSRLGLVGGVGLAIAGEGERIALGDHPPLDVLAPDEAGGEDAVVNVLTFAFAGDRLRADEAGEGPCRDRAAGVGQTAVVGARLIALGRVDPNKPEVSGADHDRVAVDHLGVSDEVGGLVLTVWCSIVASAASENKQGGG